MNIVKKIGKKKIIAIIIYLIIIGILVFILSTHSETTIEESIQEENNVCKISLEEIPLFKEEILEEVTEEELEKEKITEQQAIKSNTKYYIKVNYGANAVTIYTKDGEGNYTVPVKAMICSCGISTPKSGVYKTSKGYEWGTLMGGVYGRYSTRIVGNILFHSVPYTRMSNDALEYWEYDKLGTKASMGCVRLCVADCKWIFYNVETGTPVEFYSDSNPGPLGKPSIAKISDNERCRNWDPTANDPGSPWLEENNAIQEIPKEEVQNEVKQEINENIPSDEKQEKIEEVTEEKNEISEKQNEVEKKNEVSEKQEEIIEKNENIVQNNI